MTTFDDRARAHESLFARDQDLAFRARARRDRELGLWAARKIGFGDGEAEAYADALVALAIDTGGGEAVAAKLGEDLNRRGSAVGADEIGRRMADLLAESVEHLKRR